MAVWDEPEDVCDGVRRLPGHARVVEGYAYASWPTGVSVQLSNGAPLCLLARHEGLGPLQLGRQSSLTTAEEWLSRHDRRVQRAEEERVRARTQELVARLKAGDVTAKEELARLNRRRG